MTEQGPPTTGRRPKLEVAEIFRAHGPDYRQRHGLSPEQREVMAAIETCSTAVLGGHAEVCDHCGHTEVSYNSCRNRHCPKCQALDQARWIAEREKRVLPTHHFHLVFTLPKQLRPLVLRNREPIFDLLFMLLAEEVALALEYVHSLTDEAGRPLGLVHRDVSPSNVLVSRSGEVKLADFGIAKATRLAQTTRASIRRGKYAYMSPEQIGGQPLSARSDQFGLGVVLAELLTGERPFDGAGPVETMDRIRQAEPPDLSRLTPEVARIAARCLARSPEDRFDSAATLRGALFEARRLNQPMLTPPDLGRWVVSRLDPTPVPSGGQTETEPLTSG